MGKVSIVKVDKGIKKALYEAIELIGGMEIFVGRNDRVLLKPNLNGVQGCTNKDLVESMIQLLLDLSGNKLFMAESTFGDARATDLLFQKTGFLDLARKYHIELFNLNRSRAVEVKVKNPLALETLRIAREVYEADKIINLPNMKVHYAAGITLALKNLKGLLVGEEKKHCHEVGLEKAIVDINNTIPTHLHVVDAISCMERMGPRGGDLVELGLIMAGGSAAEVDYVGTRIMGYQLSEVKHLERYIAVNQVDLSRVEVVGRKIEEVQYPFKKVKLENIIPKEFTVHNRNACSSCMNAFLLSCQVLQEGIPEAFDIYMGDRIEEDLPPERRKIAFGNCCPSNPAFEKRLRGCPPYPYLLRDYLKTCGQA